MNNAVKAVIFDMDGVLINSEHLWRKAMIAGYSDFGINITEEECRRTMGMRFREVTALWIAQFGIKNVKGEIIEKKVTGLLLDLINNEGAFIEGCEKILSLCKDYNLKTGLATSSDEVLMKAVLKKLGLENGLDATVSAEKMRYGKPHPEVFLNCAERLGISPKECLVIEDSLNGVIAGKAAGMTVVAVPDEDHKNVKQFVLADHRFENMKDLSENFKSLLSRS
jgi:HAD superfamily hydrolase (TIGR01509 family)